MIRCDVVAFENQRSRGLRIYLDLKPISVIVHVQDPYFYTKYLLYYDK
jgi:hypothetical protein